MKYSYQALKIVRFGGFYAEYVGPHARGGLVFVRASYWRGKEQPRLVLEPGSDGYEDWIALFEQQPIVDVMVSFNLPVAGMSLADAWLAHGR